MAQPPPFIQDRDSPFAPLPPPVATRDERSATQLPPLRIVTPEVIVDGVVVDERSWPLRILHAIGSAWEWVFGVISLLMGLAFLAAIPVLSFLSLGYLLEVSGRVARTGRLRDGFVGVRKAARVGTIVLGTWLMLLPLRLISSQWYSAWLIDPGSGVTRGLRIFLVVATALMVFHIVWAWFRGGRLRHFFWPAPLRLWRTVRQRGQLAAARDAVWDFVVGLRLPYYFWLGLRGFAGAVAWLCGPVLLIIAALHVGGVGGFLLGFVGAVLLAIVLFYLSFLQTNFAVENRLVAMFDVGAVRSQFRRAPVAFWFSLLVTLAFALPLYLLKIELTPRQAAWLPALVFVAFIAPARLLTGWAVGRARHHNQPRFVLVRWLAWFVEFPVIGAYILIVFITPYIVWYGRWGLLEQHAFLLPVPFFGR